MANYEKRFTLRIPHAYRMALEILADAEGSKISAYIRRIIENFTYTHDTKMPTEHEPEVWEKVSSVLDQQGPDAFITIRVTKETLELFDDTIFGDRSTQINALIKAHILRNAPKNCDLIHKHGTGFYTAILKMAMKIIKNMVS